MRSFVASLLLLATAPASEAPATVADRWAWNARERTAAGAAALASGDAESATASFDAAARLRPDDPRTAYNAGTARIGSDPAAAAPRLDAAARAAGPELAPDAWYNLGTARLAAGDARGAAEALREALRRDPRRADAKQNLELALAEQERQQASQDRPQGSAGSSGREPESSSREDSGESETRPSEPQRSEGEEERSRPGDQSDREDAGAPGGGGDEEQQRPLPQFRDLPDMTAEQAAAILRAVEDLERQQRRERAQRAAADRATVEIDW